MRQRLAGASKEDKLLLIGLPIFTLLLLVGWAIWGNLTGFDDIEARLLTWSNIGVLTSQHLLIVVVSALIVVATAVPAGVLLTRKGLRAASPVVMGIANAGQAAPVIGVIVLLALAIGFGFWIAVLSLIIYAFLPVLANTLASSRGVDSSLIAAARCMGRPSPQALLR